MGDISRVLVSWSGDAVVGGGTTVLHCTPGGEHALMAAFRAMFNTSAAAFPSALQLTFPTTGVKIDETTGDVSGDWTDGTAVTPVSGSAGVTYVNGVGVRIKWTTGAVYEGRHVVGSTFMVPLFVSAYEGSGNIIGSTITLLSGAASTFVAAAGLRIYSRPREGVPGLSFAANGFNVPDKVTWLRSRRT